MTTPLAQSFFDYEEAMSLYVETGQEACRLRAIVLRGQLVDLMLAYNMIEIWQVPMLREQVPDWLAKSNS